MSDTEKKVTLKLLVDTKANKVLFAEAKKDFVDFLFNILSLPIGTVVELRNEEGMVGCLGDLRKSIEALDEDYLQPNVTRNTVTEPVFIGGNSVNISHNLLQLTDTSTTTKKIFYRCVRSPNYCNLNYVSDSPNTTCPNCGNKMSSALTYVASSEGATETTTSGKGVIVEGGYVKGVVTYMVMDNLEVKPMSTICCIALINKFSVKDVSFLVEKEVQVGLKEWILILKASLETRAALTTIFLGTKETKNFES